MLKPIRVLAALLCAFAFCMEAGAQAWPQKPLRFVVPYSPGGSTDVAARALSDVLSQSLGQAVVVDNRVGATGSIGSAEVAKSAPDGYTVLVTADLHATMHLTQKALSFDPVKDFIAVTQLATQPLVIAVHSSVPANSVAELIALAKSKPGSLSYCTPGIGSTHHLAGELFKKMTGIDMVHAPYKGGGEAVRDLVGGQVPVGVLGSAPLVPYVKSGRVKLLAVTTLRRVAAFPEVPALAESALVGFDVPSWLGVLLPAGTPPEIVSRLHDEIVKALKVAKVRERYAAAGLDIVGGTPAQFGAIVRGDIARWTKLVADLNLKL